MIISRAEAFLHFTKWRDRRSQLSSVHITRQNRNNTSAQFYLLSCDEILVFSDGNDPPRYHANFRLEDASFGYVEWREVPGVSEEAREAIEGHRPVMSIIWPESDESLLLMPVLPDE